MRNYLKRMIVIFSLSVIFLQIATYAQDPGGHQITLVAETNAQTQGELKEIRVRPTQIKVELGTPEEEIRKMITVEAKYKGSNKWVPVTDYQIEYDEVKGETGVSKVKITYTHEGITAETKICIKICQATGEKVANYIAYVGGYEDGTFRADNPVTREELATMIARILTEGKVPEEENIYPDLNPKRYSTPAINYVTKLGLFKPYEDGTFKASNPVSKKDFDELLTKLKAYGKGNLQGLTQKGDLLTRAEAVVFLNRLFERACSEQIFPNKYSDLAENYWAYKDIVCATNSFTRQ